MVGLVQDINRIVGLGWRQSGDVVVLLGVPLDDQGDARLGLSGSSYQQLVCGRLAGRPPLVDLDLEQAVQTLLREAIHEGLLASSHDSSDGGLAVALAECCITSGLGVDLSVQDQPSRLDRALFGEGGARVVVSVKSEQEKGWQTLIQRHPDVPVQVLGRVVDQSALRFDLAGQTVLDRSIRDLQQVHEEALPRRLRRDAES